MRKREDSPSLGQDLVALADLYLTFLWMLRQRLQYGPGWQYRSRRPPPTSAPAEAADSASKGEHARTRRR